MTLLTGAVLISSILIAVVVAICLVVNGARQSQSRFADLFSSSIAVGVAMGLLDYPFSFAADLLLGHSHQREFPSALRVGFLSAIIFFVGYRRFLKETPSC